MRSQIGAWKVGAKSAEVVHYHRDQDLPGKPLHILIPGGLLALASVALIVWVAWLTWYRGDLSNGEGSVYLALLAPVYIGCVYLFCYGYELYDSRRALRLTALLVFFSAAAVIILGVLFALLGKSGSESSDSSDSWDSGSTSRGRGHHRWGGSGGAIDVDLGGGSTGVREVVREVPVETTPAPVICSHCGTSYLPLESVLRCPSCGAARPVPAS